MEKEELKAKAKELPELPGVYLMRDARGAILYVGKSKNLRSRVGSYFIESKNHRPKVKRMVRNIDSFTYIVVDTELDALLLECDLIKKYLPIYNKLLKNDKKYRYLRLHTEAPYPRLEVKLDIGQPGKYFGPYELSYVLPIAVEAINYYYGLPSCTMLHDTTSCLHYRMGRCIGVCAKDYDQALYRERIRGAIAFLQGEDKDIIAYYHEKMERASQACAYEKAIQYREYIKALRILGLKKEAISFSKQNNKGIALMRTGKGDLKLYILEGTKMHEQRTRVFTILELSLYTYIIKQYIIKLLWNHLSHPLQARMRIAKSEIDKVQITYHFLKNREDVYYMSLEEVDWQNKEELADTVGVFLQGAMEHFQLHGY